MQDDKGTVKIDYQGLFSFAKYPTDKSTEYSISYKDFYSRYDSIFAEFHKDTILLNGLRFDSYYICRNLYPERLKYSKSIEIVFWTDKYGLTAYKSKDGEIWTKIINK